MVGMEKGQEKFQTIIDASKKASARGDHTQAEKLLKSSLRHAERDLELVGSAINEILENLAFVYELQGRTEEAKVIRLRMQAEEIPSGNECLE